MRRVMAGLIPDRVPLMCQMSIGHMLLQTGASPSAFWNSADVFAAGLLELRRVYDFDGILISLHGHSPDWERSVARISREGPAEVVHWKTGERTVFPPDDLPVHCPLKPRPSQSVAEFDPESIPDEIDFIPVSQGLDFAIDPGHRFDVIDLLLEKSGTKYSIHGEVTSPFDYYLNLFGFSEGFIALLEQPLKVREILQRFAEGISKLAVTIAGRGVDAVKVSSPYAGARFISPQLYRDFVLPCEAQIARALRSNGIPAYVHTCGAIHDRLEMMVEAGFAGLECLDPPPLGTVELADAKLRVGEKVFIKGNIDPVNVLLGQDVEAVRRDARSRVAIGKPGGRYILSTACSIAPHTPRQNVEALVGVIEEGGGY